MPAPRKLHDKFFKQAKAEGYLARSAYKLKEINDRIKLLHSGDAVLDLGCAPGSWMQVASEITGSRGVVVGIDLLDTDERALEWGPARKIAEKGDAFNAGNAARWLFHIRTPQQPHRMFDVVMSDMAPNISGIAIADQARSMHLAELALDFAVRFLEKDGAMVVKTFQGVGFTEFLAAVKKAFRDVKSVKPKSSRDRSSELYLVARGLNPSAVPS